MKFKKLRTRIIIMALVFSMHTTSFASEIETPVVEISEITASSAVLIDAKSGIVIYEKNMNAQHYPASITKIMTTLLALENAGSDLSQLVEFSNFAVYSIPYRSSHIAMNEGEHLTMENCLYGIMLQSANEVSNAVAEHISGTSEAFGLMMTKRAKELGANDTNFVNPHGLHDENHYTTAHDMALIMKEAIKQDEFIKLITTKSLYLPPTEMQEKERPLNNSHKMIYEGNDYYSEFIVGGKTGYTDEAGNTLVTYAVQDDMELIAVILHDESSAKAYKDTSILLNYGFTKFGNVKIFDSAAYSDKISIVEELEGGSLDTGLIHIYAKEDVTLFLPTTTDISLIRQELDMPYQLNPPILKDQQVGALKLTYEGNELASVNLYSSDEALSIIEEQPPFEENSGSFFGNFKIPAVLFVVLKIAGAVTLILFAIGIVSRIRRNHRKKLRRQRRRGNARSSSRSVRDNYRYKSSSYK